MNFHSHLLSMRPYTIEETHARILMDKNESPVDVPPPYKQQWLQMLNDRPFHRYPEIDTKSLREAIALKHNLPSEQVVVGNGSDNLIHEAIRLFQGDCVVSFPPTFSMYAFYATLEGARSVEIPLDAHFEIPYPQEISNMEWKTCKAICICSPNNPTGNLQPVDKIEAWLKTGAVVIIDEAYKDFCDQDLSCLLESYSNLIVLRTFSKAMGMASLRLGYALTSSEIGLVWNHLKSPYCLNGVSLFFGQKMIENPSVYQPTIQMIRAQRDLVYQSFPECCYPSNANFLLFHTGGYEFLRQRGILVRPFSGRLEGHIRVTICSPEENAAFVKAYHTYLKTKRRKEE